MSDRLLTALKDYSPVTAEIVLAQYRSSPLIQGVIDSMNALAVKVEQGVFEVRDELWLSDAVGAQLDILGRIYGVSRGGRTDPAYRHAIRLRARTGYSGTPEELIAFLIEGMSATFVEFVPEWIEDAVPAQYIIRTDIGVNYDLLQDLSPAGAMGLQGFFLVDAYGAPIIWGGEDETSLQRILHVGYGDVNFPADNVWDGGKGAIDSAQFKIKETWPFRDGSGIGEFPDGGIGQIASSDYTFLDGSFADNQGA